MSSLPIITNKADKKMTEHGVPKAQVLEVFNKGIYEKAPGGSAKMVKQYSGYEVGLFFARGQHGRYLITTVWKRKVK